MMGWQLGIEEKAYVLATTVSGVPVTLAQLAGGAERLLPSPLAPGHALLESTLERAIETAEDWLMPHLSGQRKGQPLQVVDATGRLASGLLAVLGTSERTWNLSAIEQAFLRVVDLATGRHPPLALSEHPLFVADWLLLREMAHHGQVERVNL